MKENKQSFYVRKEGMTTHAFMNGKTVSTKCSTEDTYNFAFGVGVLAANLFSEEIDKLLEGIEWARNHPAKINSSNTI